MFLFDWKLWLGILVCYGIGCLPFPKIIRHFWSSLKFESGAQRPRGGNLIVITDPWEKYINAAAEIAKGFLPILIMQWASARSDFVFWGGLAIIIGHLSSPFLKNDHAQSLLIACGVLLCADPMLLVWGGMVATGVFYFTRHGSRAILAALGFLFLYAYLMGYPLSVVLFVFFYGFIQWNLSSHELQSKLI